MTSWTSTELDTVDRTGEVDIATRRADGTLRTPHIVWIVRHDDAVYIRSVRGTTAAWYRGVQTGHSGSLTADRLQRDVIFVDTSADPALNAALDIAYRNKYGRSSAVTAITADDARDTTLRVDPVRGQGDRS